MTFHYLEIEKNLEMEQVYNIIQKEESLRFFCLTDLDLFLEGQQRFI